MYGYEFDDIGADDLKIDPNLLPDILDDDIGFGVDGQGYTQHNTNKSEAILSQKKMDAKLPMEVAVSVIANEPEVLPLQSEPPVFGPQKRPATQSSLITPSKRSKKPKVNHNEKLQAKQKELEALQEVLKKKDEELTKEKAEKVALKNKFELQIKEKEVRAQVLDAENKRLQEAININGSKYEEKLKQLEEEISHLKKRPHTVRFFLNEPKPEQLKTPASVMDSDSEQTGALTLFSLCGNFTNNSNRKQDSQVGEGISPKPRIDYSSQNEIMSGDESDESFKSSSDSDLDSDYMPTGLSRKSC